MTAARANLYCCSDSAPCLRRFEGEAGVAAGRAAAASCWWKLCASAMPSGRRVCRMLATFGSFSTCAVKI